MKKILKVVFSVLSLAILLALISCSSPALKTRHSFFAMDTFVNITINSEVDKSVFETCEKITTTIEKDISKTLPDSYIFRLNNSADELELPEYISKLISDSFQISDNTGGAFDITLQPVIKLWNLKSSDFSPPDKLELITGLLSCGKEQFSLDNNIIYKHTQNAGIDLGGVGKGYALQTVCEYLASFGLNGTVSFGGNVGVFGKKSSGEPWNISIKDPFAPDNIIGSVKLDSGYIAVSGGYERYAEHDGDVYHHIIHPATGYPADSGIASAAVISENGALSDALSTALFVMGTDGTLDLYNKGIYRFEAVLVTDDGEIIITKGLEQSGNFTPYNN